MANTLDDLYFKYIDKVGKSLESDRYFQYLYAMVQAGSNVLQQKHQILNKVVDERWIATIEDSLDAINNIIDKPRRFIATSEEVVPVSLAKKITADSVRHLSMNTQFIASNEDGEIQPTRILNVTTDESYDLYENRFIYHLIHRLIAFVDKRTDVIFWSTGNETRNTLAMESDVDDAYEQIHYKVEMTIKNTQSLVENDNDNMTVFMRIDRVRRLVFALRNSAFYSIMSGCATVRSPIQRTNLMMKDPNYRTCYKLWQFLESYDEVGYTIEVQDSALEFDDEYMIQMYTNLITNYTVFKSILDSDERNLKELATKVRKPIKPKFIKQIKEEFVDSCDLPDVEIRKVFVEEVTQAQLDAEEKLAEANTRLEKLEAQLAESEEAEAEAQRQMQALYQQLNEMTSQQMETEDQLAQAVQAQEEMETEHAAEVQALQEQYEAQLTETQKASVDTMAQQASQYTQQMTELQQTQERQLAELKQSYEGQLTEQKAQHEDQIAAMEQQYEDQYLELEQSSKAQYTELQQTAAAQYSGLQQASADQLSRQQAQYESQLAQLQAACDAQLQALQQEQEIKLASMRKRHAEEVNGVNETYRLQFGQQQKRSEAELAELKQTHATTLAQLQEEREKEQQALETDHKQQIDQIVDHYEEQITRLEKETRQAVQAGKEAERARLKAESRAEGTRLSRYIISNLSRRSRNKEQENEETDDK